MLWELRRIIYSVPQAIVKYYYTSNFKGTRKASVCLSIYKTGKTEPLNRDILRDIWFYGLALAGQEWQSIKISPLLVFLICFQSDAKEPGSLHPLVTN